MTKKRCEVGFAKSAEDDLLGILEWYSTQLVPEVGQRLVAQIIEHVEQLETYPESGRVVPEFDTPSLRELLMDPYRIVYRYDGASVSVVRVWRFERLMDTGLAGTSNKGIEQNARR